MSRNPHAWALEAQDLQVQVAGWPLLQPLQLRIPAGQWTAVVGPNGAGKSTLLRALAGLWPGAPLQHVKLHGQPLAAWPRKVRAQKVSWMGQAEPVDLSMRCYDAVMLGRLPHQAWLAGPSAQDRQVVERALHTTHAWAWRDRTLAELSGGERQRVLLARALAVQAALLLMDEPLANLDPPHQSDWMEIVRHWVAQGGTVVSVLHELGMALQADAMVIVDGGQVVHHGACSNPATHAALEAVFDHRIEVRAVDGVWTALPRSAPSQAAPTDGTYRLGPNTHE